MKFKLKVIDKMIAEKEQALEEVYTSQRMRLDQTKKDDIDNMRYESKNEEVLHQLDLLNNNVEFIEKELLQIRNIPIDLEMDKVQPGSLVETDKAIMLVGAAHEEMNVDGVEVMGVSMAAPIYEKMQDLKQGDDFELNGRKYHIKGIV